MNSRGAMLGLGLVLAGCAAPKPYVHEVARQRVLAIKGCPERYIAAEDPVRQRFELVGCGVVVSVRVVCDRQDCVPKGERSSRVTMPVRLKTTDGKLWEDRTLAPAPAPRPEAELDVKADGQPQAGAPGRVTAIGRRLSDLRLPQHKPSLPPELSREGMVVWGMYKVCVTSAGDVRSVSVIKPSDPLTDPSWIAKIETWKYAPYAIDDKPVPFCLPIRLEVRAES